MTDQASRSGRPPGARPVVVVPARFSQSAAALRYRAEVSAAKLVQAVYDAGAEPLVVHPEVPDGISDHDLDRPGPRPDLDGRRHPAAGRG